MEHIATSQSTTGKNQIEVSPQLGLTNHTRSESKITIIKYI